MMIGTWVRLTLMEKGGSNMPAGGSWWPFAMLATSSTPVLQLSLQTKSVAAPIFPALHLGSPTPCSAEALCQTICDNI